MTVTRPHQSGLVDPLAEQFAVVNDGTAARWRAGRCCENRSIRSVLSKAAMLRNWAKSSELVFGINECRARGIPVGYGELYASEMIT